ncbi:MAG: histidine phosphatase family protein [Candidatus Dormibacteraceae bacterium]
MAALGVWLVRHGATTAPVGVAIGASDPPLSESGQLQAEGLASELAHRPLSRIFASDRRRALMTAQAIASPHGIPVEVDLRLRELDFGAWEGRPLSELWREDPAAAAAWERDLRMGPSSLGESVGEFEARVLEFWTQSRTLAKSEVAVVAHRGSLAVLQALLSGASLESTFSSAIELGRAVLLPA